jgi:peptidyl-prolyl cis-trans isomerase C
MEKKVIAKVNGFEITEQDRMQYIRSLGPQRSQQLNNEEGRKHVLQELISHKLFLIDAIDNDVENSPEFEAEYNRIKDSILTQVNINKVFATIQIPEEDMKSFFDENKDKYKSPEQADTSHILVKTEEESNDIYNQIMNDEIKFGEAAAKYSSCPSKDKEGRLGNYPKGQMVPEYDQASFAMEVGEVSKPVKTQFGYHIIKLHSKTPAQDSDFENVKPYIYKELFQRKQRELYMEKVEELKTKYSVELV